MARKNPLAMPVKSENINQVFGPPAPWKPAPDSKYPRENGVPVIQIGPPNEVYPATETATPEAQAAMGEQNAAANAAAPTPLPQPQLAPYSETSQQESEQSGTTTQKAIPLTRTMIQELQGIYPQINPTTLEYEEMPDPNHPYQKRLQSGSALEEAAKQLLNRKAPIDLAPLVSGYNALFARSPMEQLNPAAFQNKPVPSAFEVANKIAEEKQSQYKDFLDSAKTLLAGKETDISKLVSAIGQKEGLKPVKGTSTDNSKRYDKLADSFEKTLKLGDIQKNIASANELMGINWQHPENAVAQGIAIGKTLKAAGFSPISDAERQFLARNSGLIDSILQTLTNLKTGDKLSPKDVEKFKQLASTAKEFYTLKMIHARDAFLKSALKEPGIDEDRMRSNLDARLSPFIALDDKGQLVKTEKKKAPAHPAKPKGPTPNDILKQMAGKL